MLKQIANVAALPGIVGHSIALPDVHTGVWLCDWQRAVDMGNPEAVGLPAALASTSTAACAFYAPTERERRRARQGAARAGSLTTSQWPARRCDPDSSVDLQEALEYGMDWSVREGYAWAEDKEHCEDTPARSRPTTMCVDCMLMSSLSTMTGTAMPTPTRRA